MFKRAMLLSAFILVTPAIALANFTGPGSQGRPVERDRVTTTVQVKEAADDSRCVLEGYIVEKLPAKHDKYLFKDAAGVIVVDIDDELFAGRPVSPETRVRLYGEVEEKRGRDNIADIDRLVVLP